MLSASFFSLNRYLAGRLGLTTGALLIAWTVPLGARADKVEPTKTLVEAISLQSGATCLKKEPVVQHVRAWLDSERVDQRLKVQVSGDSDNPRHVSISVLRGNAAPTVRRFEPGPAHCEQLHAVVGLAIAIAINAAIIETERVQGAKPTPKTKRFRWSSGVDAYLTPRVLGDLGLGGALRLNLNVGEIVDARLSLFGLYIWDQKVGNTKGRFDASLFACRVDGCAGYRPLTWLRLRACMGVAAGPLLVWGEGFDKSEQTSSAWASVVNALGAQFELNRFLTWNVEGAFVVPILRTIVDVRTFDGASVGETNLSYPGILISTGPEFSF